jgi:CheY-like chemotaxis protein
MTPRVVDLGNRTILYVEDDDATASLVRAALEEIANPQVICHRVLTVDRALQFLSKMGEAGGAFEPILILLDLNLPRRSGYELLAIIRETESFHHIRVVVFSSSSAVSDRKKSLALGAFAFVHKPSTFDEYSLTNI